MSINEVNAIETKQIVQHQYERHVENTIDIRLCSTTYVRSQMSNLSVHLSNQPICHFFLPRSLTATEEGMFNKNIIFSYYY